LSFHVPICGSSARDNAAPKKQSANINTVVCGFISPIRTEISIPRQHFSEGKVIKHAQAHRHMTASSSVLHSWDDKGNQIPFTLNVLNINSLDVEVRD